MGTTEAVMGTTEVVIRLLAGVAMILGNAFFVATEFAMTQLRRYDREETEGRPRLEKAWEMTDELEIYLTSCQLGITITSILLGVLFEPAVSHLIHPVLEAVGLVGAEGTALSVVIAVVTIQLIHTVWGEQTPTYLGVERPLRLAELFAPILFWWRRVMYPIIFVGDWLTKQTLGLFGVSIERSWTETEVDTGEPPRSKAELRRQMGDLLSSGQLTDERRREIMNALEIGDLETRDIMVDRADIYALSTENTTEENLQILREYQQARFPLIGEDFDDYVGIVYTPALFEMLDDLRAGHTTWSEVAVAPMTVSADVSVATLVDRFQTENQELALVEEAGEVVGLVTATDAFEAIIGDLEDPYD